MTFLKISGLIIAASCVISLNASDLSQEPTNRLDTKEWPALSKNAKKRERHKQLRVIKQKNAQTTSPLTSSAVKQNEIGTVIKYAALLPALQAEPLTVSSPVTEHQAPSTVMPVTTTNPLSKSMSLDAEPLSPESSIAPMSKSAPALFDVTRVEDTDILPLFNSGFTYPTGTPDRERGITINSAAAVFLATVDTPSSPKLTKPITPQEVITAASISELSQSIAPSGSTTAPTNELSQKQQITPPASHDNINDFVIIQKDARGTLVFGTLQD